MKLLFLLLALAGNAWCAVLSVATYNLEFYVDAPVLGKPAKSQESRRAIRTAILEMKADVLALQEMGSTNALLELRASLEREGLNYPYWEHVKGHDSNLRLAFLSKMPIVARRPHSKEGYLLSGRRFHVARGFAEIEVEVAPNLRVTVLTAHLKSKRVSVEADQQEMREEEAALLREKIDAVFKRDANCRLIVLGDLNDGFNSRSTRTVIGRGKTKLFDTAPQERGATAGVRPIVWTHFYATEQIYSRIDYILASPSLRQAFRPEKSKVLAFPEWGVASDHRPVLASFELN